MINLFTSFLFFAFGIAFKKYETEKSDIYNEIFWKGLFVYINYKDKIKLYIFFFFWNNGCLHISFFSFSEKTFILILLYFTLVLHQTNFCCNFITPRCPNMNQNKYNFLSVTEQKILQNNVWTCNFTVFYPICEDKQTFPSFFSLLFTHILTVIK